MNVNEYLKGKGFYTYGEDTEVFMADSADQLYNAYLEPEDDKEDYPIVKLDTEVFLKKLIRSEEKLTEEDKYNEENNLYYSTVESLVKMSIDNEWKTPFQITSSYW